MVVLLEYGDIRVTLLREMDGRRETEGPSTDDDDGIGLGDAHLGKLEFVGVENRNCCYPGHIYSTDCMIFSAWHISGDIARQLLHCGDRVIVGRAAEWSRRLAIGRLSRQGTVWILSATGNAGYLGLCMLEKGHLVLLYHFA